MKLLIDGFEIEINSDTDEANLTLTVKDASGKELANNTFVQEEQSQVEPAQMPSAQDVTGSQTEPGAQAQTEPKAQAQPAQAQPVQAQEKLTLIPSLESFKTKKK